MALKENEFFIHGGHCEIKNKKILIKTSVLSEENDRITLILAIVVFLMAAYSYLTGWVYEESVPVPWYILLILGFSLTLPTQWRFYQKFKGFTFDKEIPLASITSIRVIDVKSEFSSKNPKIIIEYKKDNNIKKRKIILPAKNSPGNQNNVAEALYALEKNGLKYDYEPK